MYTQYWKWDKRIANREAFRQWSNDVRKLYENLPVYSTTAGAYYDDKELLIGGPNNKGTGDPVFTETLVAFNGANPPDHDLEHLEELSGSVFSIRHSQMQKRCYDFCPDGRRPYDLLVCAALIRLKVHFPDVKVGSDGDPKEWMQAVQLCQGVFGPDGGHMPFTEQEEFESPSWT